MPWFAFKVKDPGGKLLRGTIEAPTEDKAIDQLLEDGYFVINVEPEKSGLATVDLSRYINWVSSRDMSFFYLQLSTMISAGISLIESLDILIGQTSNRYLQRVLKDVKNDITSGSDFSTALSRHPDVFNTVFVNLVKAGETGGMLDGILKKMAEFAERDQKLKAKLRSAMIYPVALIGVTIAVTAFLLTFIFPRFVKVFKRFGAELPLPTRILLQSSAFLSQHWLVMVSGLAVVVVIVVLWVKFTRTGKYCMDLVFISTPMFGTMYSKAVISRLVRTLGTLLGNGVNMLKALEVSRDVTDNVVLAELMKKAEASVTRGDPLHKPLGRSRHFPPMVVKMVEVGERTGSLSDLLVRIGDFFEYEVETSIVAITSIVEPVLIVVMGLLVGFVALAMLMPLFDLTKFIK